MAVLAQEPEPHSYHLVHYTDENGLPQNSVKFIVPDREGFLWLATENGLVRFDGGRFTTHTNTRIVYIFPGNGRKSLLAVNLNGLLFSISNGGADVRPVAPRPPGCSDYEYLVQHGVTGTFPATGLPNLYAGIVKYDYYLLPTSAHAYFLVGKDSVSFAEKGKEKYRFAWKTDSPWDFFTIGSRLYTVHKDGRLLLFRHNTPETITLSGDIPAKPLDAKQLYWNYVAEQLFIYQDDKCYYITAGQDGTLHSKLLVTGFSRRKNDIVSVFYDAEHERIFFGSRSRGLYVLTKKQFHPLVSPVDQDNVFYAQAPFGDNGIITAQGIAFDSAGNASRVPLLQNIPKGNRYSMERDRAGNFWYKHQNTIYKFNASLTKILWQRSFGDDAVTQLYLGVKDRLWVGTWKGGLYFLNLNDVSPVPLLFSNKVKDASYMLHESPDVLWVGTGKGLYRVQLSPLRIDSVPGFGQRYIRSLLIPRRGEVWITTYDEGIFLYRKGRVVQMPADRLGYLKTAHCITPDDRGFYWITTNKGLFQAARKDMLAYADGEQRYVYYHYYSKSNGMLTNEFNGGCQPCALQLQNGDISLPSLDGLLRFRPAQIRAELPDGPLIAGQAELDTQLLQTGDTIRLPNNFVRLGLQLSTPYYGDPYNLKLLYTLDEKEDEVWLPVENNGTIAFSRLHSGTYTLRIRKINGFGVNNYSEKRITLIVEAAWFETLPAMIMAGCILGLLIYIYTQLRIRHMRRKNRQLSRHVSERTAELENTLLSLQESEQQLRQQGVMQQRLITAITHDIKTPMKYLMLLSKTGNPTDKKSVAMGDALYRMYNMVDNLIQYMKMGAVRNHSFREYVDLHDLLEEKAGIFRPIAEIRSVRIENNAIRGLQVPVNRQLLSIVVNNLLDNAVKYTVEGSVHLAASYEENGTVSIRITDTGIGMRPEIREWINRCQALVADNRLPVTQNGIGLVIVVELLQQINGKLYVHANGALGTSMEILLQLD
ncbi:sensor histidine kinase [Chitinophaga lutea]|nr:ATP-binding protein [Chitinophaga lutea]